MTVHNLKAIVVVGSKHGSTFEIGEKIAATLSDSGIEASCFKPKDVRNIEKDGYKLAVIGSSVYAGKWRKDMKDFIERNKSSLKNMEVHLFSSGPVGNPPRITDETDYDGRKFLDELGAKQHRIFAGKIDMKKLSVGHRLMMKALRAPEGDYRDWKEIAHWTKGIIRGI